MKIGDEQVARLAELAQLALDEGERSRLAADLAQILAHFETLAGLDTAGVAPTAHVLALDCPLRPDEPAGGAGEDAAERGDAGRALVARDLVARAPRSADGFFVVPKVLE